MEVLPVISTPTYSLAYHQRLNTIVLCWLGPYTPAEARRAYRAALVLARRHGCARWLLDARRTGPLSVEVTEWLSHEFFPVAAARLAPQPLRLAVVSSPDRINQMYTDPVLAPVVGAALAAEHPYQAGIFYDEGAAVAWLMGVPA
ncbi:hypothetical protein GCM10028822_31320 [Hymenobacter terrigena]